MEFYCQKKPEEGYRHFFETAFSVKMCGAKAENIVKVKVEETKEEGEHVYWAYKELPEGKLKYIFKGVIQVKMCSFDFFETAIKKGEGKIVRVTVEEILEEASSEKTEEVPQD